MIRMATVAVLLALAGCASTAPQYYSLQSTRSQSAEAVRVDPKRPAFAVSVQPVVVPEQVARPQIVVSTPTSAQVVPLNAALWAAPLESQIRNVLTDELTRRWNVLDVSRAGASEDWPVWRVYFDVQRFDSVYDQSVRQEVVWRLVPQGMPRAVKERVCSAQAQTTVGTGMSALVEGHRELLMRLATVMASTLPSAAAADRPASLPDGVTFAGCMG
ncbi:MAG TPA: ABC-type transport auxiliary lipoprotein family protein [Burkholderiaceae bacterium]|nr:ABC-type transport auxiliary lipoprotein family protein [Burkholderiaceae bacterium]